MRRTTLQLFALAVIAAAAVAAALFLQDRSSDRESFASVAELDREHDA